MTTTSQASDKLPSGEADSSPSNGSTLFEEILAWAESGESTGGERTQETLRDLARRCRNQRSHISAYASCLDGLLTSEQQASIPGSGIDGNRDAGEIRRIVIALLSNTEATDRPQPKDETKCKRS